MHELAVCQSLIREAEATAMAHDAAEITSITVLIGPLSGVEAGLLERAYPIARAGTLADKAKLEIEILPVRIACQNCSAETEVPVNRLLCGACGDWHVNVVSGDEMLLKSVELSGISTEDKFSERQALRDGIRSKMRGGSPCAKLADAQ